MILPQDSKFPSIEFKSQMTQWGRVKKIHYLKYDTEQFLSDLNIKKSVVARTGGNGIRRYDRRGFVLIGEKKGKKERKGKPAKEFILLKRGKLDVIVDTRLVEKQMRSLEP